jgi:hypothetical protein
MGGFARRRPAIARRGATACALLVCAALTGVFAVRRADAASPSPTAYTGVAAETTTSSTTLKGSINPGGQQTSYYFQYGASVAYGAQTPATVAGSGSQTIHVTAPLVGLLPGVTYHFRLVALGPSGAVDGLDRTVTTMRVPLVFSLGAHPAREVFGSGLAVTGSLAGTGSANRAVALQANPFPYLAGFKMLGNPTITGSDGSFSFQIRALLQTTQLRVVTLDKPLAQSRALVERVAVRVSAHLRPTGRHGFVRMYGTVTPAEAGAVVRFQLLRAGRPPLTVASTTVTRGSARHSRFTRVIHVRHRCLLRAFVQVASGAQVSNGSRPILVR